MPAKTDSSPMSRKSMVGRSTAASRSNLRKKAEESYSETSNDDFDDDDDTRDRRKVRFA